MTAGTLSRSKISKTRRLLDIHHVSLFQPIYVKCHRGTVSIQGHTTLVVPSDSTESQEESSSGQRGGTKALWTYGRR